MPQHPVLTDELLAAALGPEARPDRRARAPRCFHRPGLEALVRAHPASPYLLYLPLIAGGCWRAALELRAPALLGLLLAGWLVWTLLEYWLHRGCFHLRPDTPVRRVATFIIHRHHHVAPQDRAHLVATPLYSGGLFLLLLSVYGRAGAAACAALLAGSMLGYLVYEAAHWRAHHGARGRRLRRHHLRHHFADRGGNFGISTRLWDLVFRTCLDEHVPADSASDP